ncbi:MAG: hypothetical protein GY853_06195 [PVC group bacterium]|nr:hypothetical protein [PVC group bacterium]
MAKNKSIQMLKNKKIIIGICAILLAMFVFERVFIVSLRQQSKILKDQIKIAEVRLQEYLAIHAVKDQLYADYEQCKPFLKLGKAEEKDIKTILLHETENIIRLSGGSITKLAVHENPETRDMYAKYMADVQMELTFEELLKLQLQIRDSKQLIKLDRMVVNFSDKNQAKLVIDGVLSIIIPGTLPSE